MIGCSIARPSQVAPAPVAPGRTRPRGTTNVSGTRPDWAPASIDLDVPSSARVWDYFLGGSHNFAADRQVAEAAIAMKPDMPELARQVRMFLHRAVRAVAGA